MRLFARAFLLLILVVPGILSGQNTMSPYSIFGPGELQPKGFGRTAGMGHAGIALASDSRLNNLNPASYTGIDSLHFILEIGVNGKYSGFKSQGNTLSGFNANLAYLAMGFRITNWWANSIGISPFSHVGYDITSLKYVQGSDLRYSVQYKGSGGITLAYWTNSWHLTKNLSVGLNTSYIFGPLTQEEYVSQSELSAAYILTRNDYFKTVYLDYGALYQFKIKKLDVALGAVYAQSQNLISGFSSTLQNSSLSTMDSQEGKQSKRKLPETLGGGLSFGNDRFTAALDYKVQKWAGLSYPTMKGVFRDAHNYSAGIDVRPWRSRVANKFFQNWNYRTGFHYYSTYLKINEQPINGYGLTLGIGIPLRNQFSQINFSVEAGKQGTTNSGMIRERYIMGHLNFTVNELWFIGKTFY
ncbi:MAG TPA: hypothetical protein PKJ24_00375 [Prolixibacteraceae bacterium]|nr:hypothetical protein [Prolixibacteraceae bacterium]